MPDPEDRSAKKGQRSLLSMAPKEASGPSAAAAQPGSSDMPPFIRHQMVRTRREASARSDPRPRPTGTLLRSTTQDPVVAGEAEHAAPVGEYGEPQTGAPDRLNDLFDSLRSRLPWNAASSPASEPVREIAEARSDDPRPIERKMPASAGPDLGVEDVPASEDIRPVERRRAAEKETAYLPEEVIEERSTPRDDRYWRPLIDPVRVVGGVMNSKRLIVAMTVVGAALGVYAAISIPKKYASSAEVLVDPRNLRLTEQSLTDSGLSTEATLAIVDNQSRVITSGNALDKVVDELHLTKDPEFNGKGAGGIGAVIADLRGMLSGTARRGGESVTHAIAVQNLLQSLDVEREGKTFIIDVTAKTNDPDKSALVANTVVKVFQEISNQLQEKTATRAADELTSRLSTLRAGVETAERKAAAFRASHDLVDAQGKLISDDRIVRLNDQLSAANARVADLEARAATARSIDVNSVLNGSLPEQVNSTLMGQLRAQYSALQQQSDRLAARLGPRHPERQAMEAQLAGARAQIQAELKRIVGSIQIDLKRAEDIRKNLSDQLTALKAKQATIGNDMVTMRELDRDAKAKRDVYESYLLRARQTDEQKDISTTNISVISSAYPALNPEGPSRMVISLVGAILGLLLGIGIAGGRGALASLRENYEDTPKRGNLRPAGKLRVAASGPANIRQKEKLEETVATDPVDRRSASSVAADARPVETADAASGREAAERSPIDDVRASLRDFREAVLDLSQRRSRESS